MNNLECVCCGNLSLDVAWELPQLPLTGIYVDSPSEFNFQNFHDEQLLFCNRCSHMQLGNAVSPDLLYLETYTHRTSESPISSQGNIFLREYLSKLLTSRNFTQILEIGCNDGLLLKSIRQYAKNCSGFDPVLPEGVQEISNLTLAGGFGETIEYSKILKEKIDLVITAHTFEHIVDPRVTLERLSKHLAKQVDFVIEVPSSISMVQQVRMDQVFPQHVNYYSPDSLSALLRPYGFTLSEVTHNFNYWGGTQILHFSNYRSADVQVRNLKLGDVREAIHLFGKSIEIVKSQLKHGEFHRYAFGAAQMLPVLSYHLGGLFEEQVEAIFDQNPQRISRYFPAIDVPIIDLDAHSLRGQQVLVTALDSSKKIVPKLVELGTSSILVPLGIL